MPRLGFAASEHAFRFDRNPSAGFGFQPVPKVRRDAQKQLREAFEGWQAELGSTHRALVASWLLFNLIEEGCDAECVFQGEPVLLDSAKSIHEVIWELHPQVESSVEQVQADLDDLAQRGWFVVQSNSSGEQHVIPGPSCPELAEWMLADLPTTIS